MGNKNIKKEVKKKKSTAKPLAAASLKDVAPQPDVIKKPKKESKEET